VTSTATLAAGAKGVGASKGKQVDGSGAPKAAEGQDTPSRAKKSKPNKRKRSKQEKQEKNKQEKQQEKKQETAVPASLLTSATPASTDRPASAASAQSDSSNLPARPIGLSRKEKKKLKEQATTLTSAAPSAPESVVEVAPKATSEVGEKKGKGRSVKNNSPSLANAASAVVDPSVKAVAQAPAGEGKAVVGSADIAAKLISSNGPINPKPKVGKARRSKKNSIVKALEPKLVEPATTVPAKSRGSEGGATEEKIDKKVKKTRGKKKHSNKRQKTEVAAE
jgi:hypothetical protein